MAPGDPPNSSVAGSRPQLRKRPTMRGRPPVALPDDEDEDDDFMPPKKKLNVTVMTKQPRSSPQLSPPDAVNVKKCVKKEVTKKQIVKASPLQRINIRCIPQDVLETIKIMNERQRQVVSRKGFSEILDMTLDAIGSRSHLCWLMDKTDPKDMTIHPGPGKELKITKDTVRLILGLPSAGGGKPLGIDAADAADRLRTSLVLTKDEFTVAKLQDILRRGDNDDVYRVGTKEPRHLLQQRYMDAASSYFCTIWITCMLLQPPKTNTLSSKIQQLPAHERPKFAAKLGAHDSEVEEQFTTIKDCLSTIVEKQFALADTFYEMIDDVLRAEAMNDAETPQPSNPPEEPFTPDGTQLTPDTHNGDSHDRSKLRLPNILLHHPGGSPAASDAVQTDKGPVFDKTPCGHGPSMPPIAPSPLPTKNECALSLLHFMCAEGMDMKRTVIDFGGCGGTCLDIYESFADGKCLDTDFMQCFIQCARRDISAQAPHKKNLRLILDANVGSRSSTARIPTPFDMLTLQKYLDETLPAHDQLKSFNSIMLPMLRRNHWTLCVVNFYKGCIHILDSNPYGPDLGGTTWQTFHCAKVTSSDGKGLPWARLIMNRLNKALQLARPNSCLPKFGNYKILLAPNCPTMKVGSNDCGFFVARYIQFYDYTDGAITTYIDPERSQDHRALLLYYLTFHDLNKICPLPPEIQRFKFVAQ
ncbi:hypothetical protein U9M48_031924 [Paspalum notatum var. saurae]|uniref:Ubiquitin-like protease family profile domain-containing protein n=1 Tax=Paspalum notatum var. saurae TaxID=547442 RepID=A0AAQ3X3W8_PASNO